MNRQVKNPAWKSRTMHFLLMFYFLYLGCSDRMDYPESHPKRGVKFFEMDSSSKLKDPAISNLAKQEGMNWIESGEFWMGSPINEEGRNSDEKINRVRISHPFWIKTNEVTNGEWNVYVPEHQKKGNPVYSLTEEILKKVCTSPNHLGGHYTPEVYQGTQGNEIYFEEVVFSENSWSKAKKPRTYRVNPKQFSNLDILFDFLHAQKTKEVGRLDQLLPVVRISYSQAVAYCWEKTEKGRLNGSLPSPFVYRLPTEAEWEYTCRAGTQGFCGLEEGNFLSGENANINGSMRGYIIDHRPKSEFSEAGSFVPIFRKGLVPIRKKATNYPTNQWGLHHMHGNVLEWCYDYYGLYPEGNLTRVDPIGPIRGTQRVVRGGSFIRSAHQSRSAKREKYEPSYRGSEIGFRYVLAMPLR